MLRGRVFEEMVDDWRSKVAVRESMVTDRRSHRA